MSPETSPAAPRLRIGERLLDGGLIDRKQLEQALEAQRATGGRLGTRLLMMGAITEAQLAEFLSEQLGLPAMHRLADVQPEAVRRVPGEVAREHQILPVRVDEGRLWVAFADPSDDVALAAAERAARLPVVPVVAPELVVSYGIRRFYEPDARHVPEPGRAAPQFAREPVPTPDL